MQVLIVLVVCSLVVALGFLAAFFWSVKNNQYEDTYTPSMRILFDDTYSEAEAGENNSNDTLK